MSRFIRGLFVSLTIAAAGQCAGRAEVIYSSLGPGDSYSSTGGQAIITPSSNGGTYAAHAAVFTVGGTGDSLFTSAELPLLHYVGDNSFIVRLYTESNGLPGTILESFDVIAPTSGLLTVVSAGGVVLEAGRSYFLAALPLETSFGIWYASVLGGTGDYYSFDELATWHVQGTAEEPAFRINGTAAVPEPASLALAGMALGVVALPAMRRHRTRI
ncbi:MAG: hypothetical protein BGO49_00775 [Planctomycetales bacterium 71-10]|nr:MAG: hypothetical protein BGO49_00775 [Planctomycetales bacterium 71-10]